MTLVHLKALPITLHFVAQSSKFDTTKYTLFLEKFSVCYTFRPKTYFVSFDFCDWWAETRTKWLMCFFLKTVRFAGSVKGHTCLGTFNL